MKLTILGTIILSSLLLVMSAPATLVVLIILQTINLCIMIWIMSPSAWFSFILFLIFVGGLMVLFIYITSLANNEMFETNMMNSNPIPLIALAILLGGQSLMMAPQLYTHSFQIPGQTSPLFSLSISYPTIIVMSYLLVTLIVVVKMSSKMEGPMRNAIKTK